MVYTKRLPPVRQLLSLSQHCQFPATQAEITRLTKHLGAPESVTDFLALFPKDEAFNSPDDFMTRSEELEMLIGQERAAPQELLRSP